MMGHLSLFRLLRSLLLHGFLYRIALLMLRLAGALPELLARGLGPVLCFFHCSMASYEVL